MWNPDLLTYLILLVMTFYWGRAARRLTSRWLGSRMILIKNNFPASHGGVFSTKSQQNSTTWGKTVFLVSVVVTNRIVTLSVSN